jgi:DNA-binding protein HU-beta
LQDFKFKQRGIHMTKTELVDAIAGKAGLSKAKSAEGLSIFIDAITGALKKGDKVTLIGFGTFSVAKRAARTGVNPRTKEKIKIKASKVAHFKAGQAFKDAVNKK